MTSNGLTHSPKNVVIVGASLAGGRAAAELREHGFDGHVCLIGAEPELPYERPPLSKDYLRGETERAAMQVHDLRWWHAHDVALALGSPVTEINAAEQHVKLAGGLEIPYDALLLATGASPRPLKVPGADLDGIHYLRNLADAEALRARIKQGGRLAIVGAGWIGSEVAASARQLGAEVTVIDPLELPNVRVFGEQVGAFYRDVHIQHGVRFELGEQVEGFEGGEQLERVRTKSGKLIECDFAVVAVGVTPNVGLARAAGIATENGIVADSQLRSSLPGVWAAGDVASVHHQFYDRQIRLEHWSAALEQGPAAARSMLGDETPYDVLPYFFSDQYDVGMEYSGLADPDDEVVLRGDPGDGEFVAFWLDHEGRVDAGMNVNVWDVNEHVQTLIRSRQPVDRGVLADPDSDLGELAASLTAQR